MRAMCHCTTWVTVYLWSRYSCSRCGMVISSRSWSMEDCAPCAWSVQGKARDSTASAEAMMRCGDGSMWRSSFEGVEPQILRLHLAQKARQISLRMTTYFWSTLRYHTRVSCDDACVEVTR